MTWSALIAIDAERADRALESLGNLLRYALGTENEVLFAQEWLFVGDYLAFEQLRFGDQLVVEARHDAAALAVTVPPLILQPLVENAVRHGVGRRADGGRICLTAVIEDDRLVMRVADDGSGTAGHVTDGIGLGSVRRRLAATYGDRATLTIGTGADGCVATITLPLSRTGAIGSAA